VKYLREIAQIVTRYREKNPDLMDFEPSPDDPDMTSKLYLGLREGKITTDLAAAELVYGSPLIDTRYTSLKNRLKKRLINLLFFLDIREKDFSEQLVARYQNSKAVFWVNTLSTFGARSSAIKLAESALKQAMKYDFTYSAIQCAQVLRNYSRFSGSERQYDKYDELMKDLIRRFEAEVVAQELYERITIRYSRSLAEQPELKMVADQYLQTLESFRKHENSFTFNQYYFRLKAATLQIAQQYEEAIKTYEEGIAYFDAHKHMSFKILYGDFYLQELGCFLYLRQYEQGKQAIDKCKDLIPEGGANWFILMENRFLLEMYALEFHKAEEVFVATNTNARFQFLSEDIREKWQLYELYLDFALRQSKTASARATKARIEPERFIKTVPTFKRDKRGYNIAILILHVLFLLEQNDFGSIIGRMDALRTYRNRYLKVGTNRRSALFFKMLQIMESNSFDPAVTLSKSKKYVERLSGNTADAVEAQENLQIIPFEWLWDTIIKMLQEKQRQGKL
jgi:hypothetical protein